MAGRELGKLRDFADARLGGILQKKRGHDTTN
jgi:hypothetical protein